MKLILICAFLSLCTMISAQPSAEAATCYSKKTNCTGNEAPFGPCTQKITSHDAQCVGQGQVGDWTPVQGGAVCATVSAGATGCIQSVRMTYFPPSTICKAIGGAYLLGIGCCGQPCPPPGTNCQPE